MLAAAARAGVRAGRAPDTVFGTGAQTAVACPDAGEIGTRIATTAFMVTPGHERWHPAPESAQGWLRQERQQAIIGLNRPGYSRSLRQIQGGSQN